MTPMSSPRRMFCKKLTAPLVTKLMVQDPLVDVVQKSEIAIRYDPVRRFVDTDNYLTIMRRVHQRQFLSQMLFGMPSDYILFQDIMISYPIDKFRACFESAWKQTHEFKNQLGDRTDSVSFQLQQVLSQIRFHALFQPMLYKKQLIYSISLLHKFTPTSQKCLIFCPFTWARQLAENMHKIAIEPGAVFRGGHGGDLRAYIESDSESGRRIRDCLAGGDLARGEVVEKMVVLNLVKNWALEMELLENRQNIFAKTVFAGLFGQMSIDQIIEMYQQHKSRYMEKIGQIMQQRLANVQKYSKPINHIHTLAEMIQVQGQRLRDFPVEMLPLNREIQNQTVRDKRDIVEEVKRISKSELGWYQKEIMELYFKGVTNREGVILYSKLFVQAKIRLGKSDYKLPRYFYSELSGIFKEQMKDAILKKNLKQAIIDNLIQENKSQQSDSQYFRKLQQDPEALQQFMDQNASNVRINNASPGQSKVQLSLDSNTINLDDKETFMKKMQSSQLLRDAYQLCKGNKQFLDDWNDEGQANNPDKKKQTKYKETRGRGVKMPKKK